MTNSLPPGVILIIGALMLPAFAGSIEIGLDVDVTVAERLAPLEFVQSFPRDCL